jgi:hypothetical protein
MSKDTKKYIRGILSTKVDFFLILYIFQTWDIGKHGRKYIGDVVKAPKKCF